MLHIFPSFSNSKALSFKKYLKPEVLRPIFTLGMVCGLSLSLVGCLGGKEEKVSDAPVQLPLAEASPESGKFDVKEFNPESSPYDAGTSLLHEYYLERLSSKEASLVERGIKDFFADYDESDLDTALRAVMGYQYVVYHTTDLHNLKNNIYIAKQAEPKLKVICETLNVPLVPVLGIICWENSGDTSKISYANAAGLGQMTDGAVETAHMYGKTQAKNWREEAARLRLSVERNDKIQAERLEKAAKMADCEERHAKAAKDNKAADERLIMECNLEDTVLFFKYLLSKYDNRADLAAAAYHNGLTNSDDVIYDYLQTVKDMNIKSETDPNRRGLVEAIKLYNLKYTDLWNNKRSREILCGIRTITGEKANADNADMALGDESDLYVWKVAAAYAAMFNGENFTSSLQQRYSGSIDECAAAGLPSYDSAEKMSNAAKSFMVCSINKDSYKNFGVDSYPEEEKKKEAKPAVKLSEKKAAAKKAADKKAAEKKAAGVPPEIKKMCWYASPELSGYLSNLQMRWGTNCGNNNVRLPLKNISGAWAFESSASACPLKKNKAHYQGIAADLDLNKIPAAQRSVLERLIIEDFLLDVVYISKTDGGTMHIVLNPRCGLQFLEQYIKNVSPSGRIAKARENLITEAEEAKAREQAINEAKLSSNPQYRNKAAREEELRRRIEEDRQFKEMQAKEAAQSRASAAKKRVARKAKAEEKKPEAQAPSSETENELYAIPDEESSGAYSGSRMPSSVKKSTTSIQEDDSIYSF